MFKSLDEAVAAIHSRPKAGKKDSFERMQALLSALNHPEEQMPPAIHITGTNGKGSVATMVSAVAKEAGYRVGSFTSPFIVDFRERFQINGQLIEPIDLVHYANRVQTAIDQVESDSAQRLQPTEFEMVTAIMLVYFVEANLDLAVIEVGIGGRYDSTNVLTTTKVAVITTVALDHQAMLGNTVEEIAAQKAGIIKEGTITILGPNLPAGAQSVIVDQANQQRSPVQVGVVGEFQSGMHGSFQAENTATAVAALRAFNPELADSTIASGLKKAFLPGRFEEVQPGLYLDGAHNQAGLHALHQTIQQEIKGPVTVIIAALADKNVDQAFWELAADKDIRLVFVPFAGLTGRPGLTQAEVVEEMGQQVDWYESLEKALAEQKQRSVVVTGSLYFISDVRRKLCKKKS
ncbi:FolC family protein [Fructobacillus pseudoficulneus]|uniref:tetrahydrofolate synthase n=1 Tax=Fructobacillus pseudoficulneus TaxID=220714 RepID=A0A3F3H8R9_9LACO|nr:folylpolyglutamate synthase/dihydrofolate synthase family protein [Fructobacillus pseudoficulneus]GAP02969.1 FolC family protein [Fructobacillus pseudoficulneus]SEH44760.1 dihydrofolate synthase / folylpolyglutamate synthase [Fructobacillus pseudoficulneus]